MNIKISDNIDWVGYVDWTVRDFHGYETARGATYNAYLVRDEKTALIDTVKRPFADALLANVAAVVDLGDVDYVVCNHAEPDHAGALPRVMAAMPHAELVCNKRCAAALARHADTSGWKIRIVDNDAISLGGRTLQFIDTPMVHWPESMFTYLPEDRILFSMDAFGQHYATSQRFDDEVSAAVALDEAKTYYANIVMPYGRQVAAVLDKAAALPIDLIAPSHGIVWRSHVADILAAYRDWSTCRARPKVVVIYDTMWDATGEMARAIHEGASQPGVEAVLIHVRLSNLTRIAAEMLDVAAVAFGSSTLNRGMMPMAAAVLNYLEGLRPANKAGFAFGSYGWGTGGAEAVHGWLESQKWDILREPLRVQYRPTPDVLDECRRAGRLLAERARSATAER
ncbi:MAG: FprA family A-type flavoprotein [Pirellulales bacterium]|nr:FprA family A-type flavoprotein [Pirellulales bacterium]